ncbi:UNVERIFIED_CONTAM: hypothetical protein GTU68_024412 [Idotea baltica]|nr:hypothetical protein [Idotea baltica]
MTQLLFIPGSLRQASSSRATIRSLADSLNGDCTSVVADPGLLPHFNSDVVDDAHVDAFRADVEAADGVVFVTPEYNYSVPGLLKNAIDWASRPSYGSVFFGKPCFVITVSAGALGGVRAQGQLKYVLNGMLADVFATKEIVIPFSNKKVEDGLLADEGILEFATAALRDFLVSIEGKPGS